jgi:mannose-6-phosphate isomerase-like protein (cupin superfamily)
MVLEGELFIEYEDRIEGVRSGEVIPIPSQVPHAVFTREKSIKAIDAWSSIIEKYHQKDGEQNEKSVGL